MIILVDSFVHELSNAMAGNDCGGVVVVVVVVFLVVVSSSGDKGGGTSGESVHGKRREPNVG